MPEERRGTLIVEPGEDGYRFDVHVQGERETVFFQRLTSSPASSRAAASPSRSRGRAWLQALLDFEAALARAQARAGVITRRGRERDRRACDVDRFDVAAIGAGAAEIGNPAGRGRQGAAGS